MLVDGRITPQAQGAKIRAQGAKVRTECAKVFSGLILRRVMNLSSYSQLCLEVVLTVVPLEWSTGISSCWELNEPNKICNNTIHIHRAILADDDNGS